MNETELQHKVQAICEELDLLWHHCCDPRKCTGNKGLPDLIIVGPGGLLLAELKSDDGTTSAHQDLWLWQLSHTPNTPGRVWRPADLESGRIRRELAAIADTYRDCVNSTCPQFPHRYEKGKH